jgi:hypothetical protein
MPHRLRRLKTLAFVATTILFAKVLLSIVLEYRWYFPANFESAFLTGRRESFVGLYRAAFYAHILGGPVAILLGAFLVWSGARARFPAFHRWAGRVQIPLILVVLVPSGLVMATQALAGPIAGFGFASLSVATGVCAVAAVYFACNRLFTQHQLWATRCWLLLLSPLIFRLASGALIVTAMESANAYCANAWLSWLLPLAIYEAWRRRASHHGEHTSSPAQTSLVPEPAISESFHEC